MSSIDDLKTTLHHAAEGPDHALAGRPAAVRERVRVVRRRRRVAVAGAVAAVVAVTGIGLGVGLDGGERADTVDPARGLDIERSIVWNGFEYAVVAAERVELSDATTDDLRVEPGDGDDLLLTVATDGLGGGDVTVRGAGEVLGRASDALPVTVDPFGVRAVSLELGSPAGAAPTPSGDATVTWAVYERTDALPEGPSDGHAVWRERIGGTTLVAGGFSEPGRGELEVAHRGRLDDLSFSTYCRTSERGLFLHVAVDGGTRGSGHRCTAEPGDDPTSIASGMWGTDVAAHTFAVWVTRDELGRGEPVTADDLVVGVGVYEAGERFRVHDMLLGEVIQEGTLWRRDRVHRFTSTAQTVRIDTTDGPVSVHYVTPGGPVSALVAQGRRPGSAFSTPFVGAAGRVGIHLPAGDVYAVGVDTDTVRSDPPGAGRVEDVEASVVVYRPLRR
ncbi:hypothetical protein [Nocardioides sp. zg-DK7169]|uniref:hypothetical protein n=1 Tax=Nocardioides sp. zg-DK7169 TaxID=2736600 RepID=UPI001555689C|nr:hypothetical protein [Nocardioides sp. zg-DK7169]NPC97142.1 hypothetical protein [Nocardioides sp. zg-DK7169]